MKGPWIEDFVGVYSESAKAHGAKLLVPNRNGIGCAPFLVKLEACAEEIDIRLKWRLKKLVPVHQVRQQGQRLGGEFVASRAKDVGHSPFVHKDSHLGLTDGERGAILDLE